jgi:fumarate hydratase subunit beta
MSRQTIELSVAALPDAAGGLNAGDRVYLTGIVYTARDAAHKKLMALIENGGALPFDLRGSAVYYAGPTPSDGRGAVGSCGPTTSSRMDSFTPALYDLGLAATIGKGGRSAAVKDAIIRNGAVYLCAVGGAGALIAKRITAAVEIAFPELGCESVKRLTVDRLPLFVGIDCGGKEIFV